MKTKSNPRLVIERGTATIRTDILEFVKFDDVYLDFMVIRKYSPVKN